jgi:hypothetical protein
MKKIVIITRYDTAYPNGHLFTKSPEQSLDVDGELYKFLFKLLPISITDDEIKEKLKSDEFMLWVDTLDDDDETKLYYNKISNIPDWSDDSSHIEYFRSVSAFTKNHLTLLIESKKAELTNNLAFKYKKISLSEVSSEAEDFSETFFKNSEIIILPCYERESSYLKYTPKNDKKVLIEAICMNFKIEQYAEEKENINYLFVHDNEWGKKSSDYQIWVDTKKNDKEYKDKVGKYFNNNVRIFSHSEDSFYFNQILLHLDNLKNIEQLEVNRSILKNTAAINLSDIKNKLDEHKYERLSQIVNKKSFDLFDSLEIEKLFI